MKLEKKFEKYFNEGEIELSRTAEEFIRWFEGKLAITKEKREELREQNLLHVGIAKIFYEELFPLYRFLQNKREEWRVESFAPVLGNQNYDVAIQTSREDVPKYIEIIITDMDKDEYFRMKCLVKDRSVEMGNRDVKALIVKSIDKKMSVVERPQNTALLIYFDDYVDFRFDDETAKFKMNSFIDSLRLPWKERYAALYVVGASGKSFYERV